VVVQLLAAERRKANATGATDYDAFLRSYDFLLTHDRESYQAGVDALRRVVERDPDCGPAWTRLARLYVADHTLELTSSPAPIEEAITCAQRGVRSDAASRSARSALALALLVKGELAAARDELDEALRTSAESLVHLEVAGFVLTMLGDVDRGPALTRRARQLNPHCLPYALFGIWADQLRRGAIDAACQTALEHREGMVFWRPVMRACCLGLLGRIPEARREVAELLSRKPNFRARGRVLRGRFVKTPELMRRIVDGLSKAGLALA
jgi:tetratricopeptide (TPR) repeat protein